jgi:MarR family 2-MHQ and catechol resistance regulon transcriptional repressor
VTAPAPSPQGSTRTSAPAVDDRPDSTSRVQESAELFGLLARVVHRTAQDAAAILRTHDLNPAQFQLLRAVRDRPGSTQVELGGRFGVTGGNVSMLLTKLEAAGLLRREPRGAAKGIWLTEAGERVVDRLEPEQSRFMADRFIALSDEELSDLHRLMTAVVHGLPDPA